MILDDGIEEMEITAFDNHAEAMTGVKLSLLAMKTELDRENVPEEVQSVVNKKFTVWLGLSPRAISEQVLTYRIYKVNPITEQITSLAAGVSRGLEMNDKEVLTEGDKTDDHHANLMEESPTKKQKRYIITDTVYDIVMCIF